MVMYASEVEKKENIKLTWDKQLTTTYLIAAEPPKIYLFLVKLVVYYQSAFWLVELRLGYML